MDEKKLRKEKLLIWKICSFGNEGAEKTYILLAVLVFNSIIEIFVLIKVEKENLNRENVLRVIKLEEKKSN